MCKVVAENPEENIGYVLYNHIFARKSDDFTVDCLEEELSDFDITREDIRKGIELLFHDGVISQWVGYYKRRRNSLFE